MPAARKRLDGGYIALEGKLCKILTLAREAIIEAHSTTLSDDDVELLTDPIEELKGRAAELLLLVMTDGST